MSANPYESPNVTQSDAASPAPLLTWRRMLALVGIGTLGGIGLGACTNAINGLVSPQYFGFLARKYGTTNEWLVAFGHGIVEGAVYGAMYGLLFVALISLMSRRRCAATVVMRYAFMTVGLSILCWLIGGIVGLVLHQSSVQGWTGLGRNPTGYAWVKGSIIGICRGTVIVVILMSVSYILRYGPHSQRAHTLGQSTF